VGYSEYRPLRPNDSAENRALNRRVDIVIMSIELWDEEPN
jgi:chemotaxis protein MotB